MCLFLDYARRYVPHTQRPKCYESFEYLGDGLKVEMPMPRLHPAVSQAPPAQAAARLGSADFRWVVV